MFNSSSWSAFFFKDSESSDDSGSILASSRGIFVIFNEKKKKKKCLKRGLGVPKKRRHKCFFNTATCCEIQSWIIHDQIYVHKHTHHFYVSIHLFISSITIYSSHPPWWAAGGDKRWLLQCFVRGFKAAASLQRCQRFDVTRHFPRTKPTASSCLRPARRPKNNKTTEFKPAGRETPRLWRW